jgi:hypothetical protein
MEVVIANKLIETGFTLDYARKLFEHIDEKITAHPGPDEKFVIDFDEVKFFTTQFFNNSISKYVLTMGPEEFEKKFSVINLSEAGQSTYKHSFDNAVSYFKLPAEKRLEQDRIVNQCEDSD